MCLLDLQTKKKEPRNKEQITEQVTRDLEISIHVLLDRKKAADFILIAKAAKRQIWYRA